MKSTKGLFTTNIFWIALFSLLTVVCIIAIFLTYHSAESGKIAKIYSDNKLIQTVSLEQDSEFKIKNGDNYNIICVKNGKISVIESDCKNQICVNHGAIDNGLLPIVCVPNGLVIRVESDNQSDIDAEIWGD